MMETKMEEMDDWKDASSSFVSTGRLSSCWDDEDVENNQVKESWEDEDDSTLVPSKLPPPNKSTRKVVPNAGKKKEEIVAAAEKEDNMEEKLCQLSLVGRADSGSHGDQSAKKSVDSFVPTTETDFIEYAELISEKLCAYEHSYYYINLLKDVIRFSTKALRGADVKAIASWVVAVSNEKLKAEREADGRKRKASKKKKIYVEKEDSATVDAFATFDARVEHDKE